jgi:Ala-tRNA(Pro) deacylase
MSIAKRLKAHLDAEGVAYETVDHPRTTTSSRAAEAAHIPGSRLAKTVVIHLENGPVLAVVPSSHRVDLGELQSLLDRRLGLASETEIGELFDDCDLGAAPPVGSAYNVPTVLDRSLSGLDRVWFEGGDHRTLVSVAGADFDRLMRGARMGGFSHAV